MIRPSLSFTLSAAALAVSLFTAPAAAAQSTVRPAIAESGAAQDDAVNLRRLIGDESVHRNRVAKLARLRALAAQQGARERLADLDRLERLERERHEARRLQTRSRLTAGAQREADDFVKRGGVLKLRRANLNNQADAQGAPTRRAGTERSLPQRKATVTRRPKTGASGSSGSGSSSSRGGRSGSGGRGPR